MSQISPPIRIVLIAVIGLVAAYMLVLRPKDPSAVPPAPAPAAAPGMTGLGNAVDQANGAAAKQEARDAEVQKATGGGEDDAAAVGSAKAAPTNAEAALATGRVLALAPLADEKTKDLPAGIRKALARRDVLAIGVFNTRNKKWAPMAADDRRVRRALKAANRYGGRVTVHSATLGDLTRLRPVIGELNVAQTPSVVVVDRNRKATLLEGYVDRVAINQAIADARRDSIAFRIKNTYLSEANELCGEYALRTDRFRLPTSRSAIRPAFRRLDALAGTYVRRFAQLTPPARYKGLHGQLMGALRGDRRRVAGAGAALNAGNPARALALLSGVDLAAAIAFDRRLDRAGLTSCVGNRRS